MPEDKAPEPYQPKSLLELISPKAVSHLLTGYRESLEVAVTMYCRDEHAGLRRFYPADTADEHMKLRYWPHICWKFRSKGADNEKCHRFEEQVVEKLLSETPHAAVAHQCGPLGLTDVAAQIVVAGRIQGVVIAGQRLPKDVRKAEALRHKILQEHPGRADELSKALDRDYGPQSRWPAIADDAQVEELRHKIQDFADLVSDICQKVADGNTILRQRQFVQYCIKGFLDEPPRTAVGWQASLCDCLAAFVRFAGSPVQRVGLFYGEQETFRDAYSLAAMDSQAWWPIQRIVLPHGDRSGQDPNELGKVLDDFRKTLCANDPRSHVSIFPFRYRQPRDQGDLFSLMAVQMDGKPSDATMYLCREFSSAVCAADALARLFQRQQRAYSAFEEHIMKVRHDLLTSVQYLVANVESAMAQAKAPEAALAVAKENVRKHRDMVALLRAPTMRAPKNMLRSIDVVAAIRRQVDECAVRAAQRGIRLEIKSMAQYDVHIVCDPAEFYRAVLALIDNAIKYSFDNRTVTITLCTRGESLDIEVMNYGIGISAETIARLMRGGKETEAYDPLRHREGSGLGIPVARSVFENMLGGTMKISSQETEAAVGSATSHHVCVIRITVTLSIQEQEHV